MSITTFEKLINSATSRKTILVEIQPSQHVQDWDLHSGSIYKSTIGTVDVQSVYEDGSAYTVKTSISAMSASTYYYDGNILYVQCSSGTPYAKVIVANYKVYISNDAKVFNNHYYEPSLLTIPVIKQSKPELFWGVSIISSGKITLSNGGLYDEAFHNWAWANKQITVLFGGEDLPYTEYDTIFDGIIIRKRFSTDKIDFDFEDKKRMFESSLPYDAFDATTYPNIDPEDVGKPIPYVWGTVSKMPVVCTNKQETTSTYSFKICSTSTHSISEINTVYVNDVARTALASDTGAATFTIDDAFYAPGDMVSVDCVGYLSGTVLSNPIDILRELTVLLEIPDSDWDTTARATAYNDAADFPCCLVMDNFTPVIDSVAQLMKSCMGNFYINNDGKYTVTIWTPDISGATDSISDIEIRNLSVRSETETIRKILRCGWKKKWANDTYAYRQKTSGTTKYIYDIDRSRTVDTLQTTADGVDLWLARMELLYASSTNELSFDMKMQFIGKNIGDRFLISFRRRREDSDIPWISSMAVEIQSITKNFMDSIIKLTVDDLKGAGADAGKWTANPPSFPTGLGGASVTAWDSSWSAAQKSYAHDNWGFWTDADGLIDPADGTTLNQSRWW
jgi:hypothetical protein